MNDNLVEIEINDLNLIKVIEINEQMPLQKSNDWLEDKKNKISGSEVADAIGVGYKKESGKNSLLFRKCGYDPYPFKGNIYTEHGNRYELAAIQKYLSLTDNIHIDLNIIPHNYIDFIAYSPDGICIDKDGNIILIEVKCPYTRKIVKGEIPSYYIPQVQLGMQVLKSY